ncbi:MAG TPA: choice-of-anchor Q domain-containing protein [Terracidiphilus sp.]
MKPTLPPSLRQNVRRRRLCLMLFALCGALLCQMPLAAQTTCNYTVTTLADSGTGSLRAGLADSTATEICFGLSGTISLASSLQILTPVTITDSGGVTISGGGTVQLFVVNTSSTTDAVRINGLTLTNGFAGSGGALWVQRGDVTLVGTNITGNSAGSGGGVYNQATLTLAGCAITNNTAINGTGGGIENVYGGILTLHDSAVTGNVDNASPGGGVDNGGSLTITGGTFRSNQATRGGAISNNSYYASVYDSAGTLFISNTASVDGGAIYNQGYLSVIQALFNGNASQSSVTDFSSCGGAICNLDTANINESTFTTNTTTGSGGAIQNYASGYLNLEDDTIAGNMASVSGSGLDIASTAIPVINNTIIAGNTAIAGAANSDCNGCIAANGVANLIGVTVNLGPLALNGGPTETMMPLPGSPAINGGNPTPPGTEGFDTIDQRGFSRLNPSGGLDIGAVQTHYSSVSFLTQPGNTLLDHTITPAVAVQVMEVDNTTTNYPQGVPVNVSLQTPQGVQVTGALTGTLTHNPTVTSGVTSAVFADLAVNTAGTYKLFATTAISGNSASADPAYSSTSSSFQIATPVITWQPAAFLYGPLPASELNATATLFGFPGGGTFVYTFVATGATINAGQIYPAVSYPVQVAYTPTGSTTAYLLPATLVINRAAPVLTWATPAPILTSTALSATQLDATAAGVTGAALPGAFVYNPATGTQLAAGSQMLTTTFTPTDTVDYTTATAQVTIQVNYAPITIASVSPSTTPLSTSPLPIAVTGSGFTSTSVVEVNGTALATTFQSATALTATIPKTDLAAAATLSLTVYDPTSKLTSNVVPITVTAPSADVSVSVPSTTTSGEQPGITIALNSPYPSDLIGTLALTFAPKGASGVDDPAVQFSTGGRTLNFTVPAGSTTIPAVALQTGTVAGTITVTLALTTGGADVTPAGVSPITLVIAPAAPVITSVKFTNGTAGLITVAINGFSNTREMTQATFVFTGSDAQSLGSAQVQIPVSSLFSPWYSSSTSDQYGSEFTYTQNFQLSKPDSNITGVSATLANSIGTSGSVNSQ